MTVHNTLGQAPQITRAFPLATGLQEDEEGVVRLGETLTPTMNIYDHIVRPEWALIRGEIPCAQRLSVSAGGAGTNAGVGLGNPTGSGRLVVVEAVSALGVAGNQISLYIMTDLLLQQYGNPSQGARRDRRGGQTFSVALMRSGNTPVGIPAGGQELEVQQKAALDTLLFMCLPIMLWAGDGLLCVNNATATGIQVAYKWRERQCILNEAKVS